jgi:hypothetical protein
MTDETEESLRARAEAVIRRAQELIVKTRPAFQRWHDEGEPIPPALRVDTLRVCDELDALMAYADPATQGEALARITTAIADLRAAVEQHARDEGGPNEDDQIH